jgi:hypothetical protein
MGVTPAWFEDGDTAHHLTSLDRQEKVGIGMAIEGMAIPIQLFAHARDHRRNPLWAISVQAKRELDKSLHIPWISRI